ncbi:TPA: ogr/Delta-like zinc finger family protein [Yersinia enterocolitica]|uniref:ogr/Delta-like zinc finger family protein n=1 Tax=Yersinia sp. LJYL362 TaxID=3402108 RepID=UPI002AC4302F|nr:ogr/Delta-like zinc finger family protein [Yersinia enterocolitica]HEN3630459.1 ogr/Delta-like zinc finger family protein [Yersinia enterocolitica]HEN3657668.1 ogr/Delta-like zinc finger family protein [Yersinia enterocolitica]HEN3663411.1 ogr/Delta-like zinc finger family protein [Yersinia enterocolitica]
MMSCPQCGAVSRTRTSRMITGNTKENYHQCQNLLCSCTFTTLQSVDKILSRPSRNNTATLPRDLFLPGHLGDDQFDLAF